MPTSAVGLEAPIPVLVLRFEDMKQQPLKTFTQAAQFAGLPDDPARVRKALEFSDFKELQDARRRRAALKRDPGRRTGFFEKESVGPGAGS